jgi:ectoine hydroxylase-related dioxygenase (phytanoyl-CoA dioxygenase family)
MSLNLLVYLQDLTDGAGPLRVIPGSHRCPLLMTEKERQLPHAREQMIHARAGDGVLIHNNLVHSRSRNKSRSDRIYLSIVYSLTCMRPAMDPDAPGLKAIANEIRKTGNPRLMRLFGEDRSGAQRYNCGFMSDEADLWRAWIAEERELQAPTILLSKEEVSKCRQASNR